MGSEGYDYDPSKLNTPPMVRRIVTLSQGNQELDLVTTLGSIISMSVTTGAMVYNVQTINDVSVIFCIKGDCYLARKAGESNFAFYGIQYLDSGDHFYFIADEEGEEFLKRCSEDASIPMYL